MNEIISFAQAHVQVATTFHILGVCLGLGGATLADTFFFRFLKDFRISTKEAEVMQWISKVILFALVIIYVSGALLYLSDMERYLHSPPFLFKSFCVFMLTVNGIALHEFISPRLVHISFLALHPHVSATIHRLRKIAFAMGAVSVTSWYCTFFTAMLKSILPPDLTFVQMLLGYIVLLSVAVTVSQLIEAHLHRIGSRS